MAPSPRPFAGPALLLGLLLPPAAPAQEKDPAAAEDERVVREAKVPTDAAGLLAFFRKRTPSADDQQAMRRLVRQLGSRSFAKREEASRRLAAWGPPAVAYLAPALGNA